MLERLGILTILGLYKIRRHLLGTFWEGPVYVDKALLFGLKLATIIFSVMADALLWIVQQWDISWAIHYVDDFFTMGKAVLDEYMYKKHNYGRDLCHGRASP